MMLKRLSIILVVASVVSVTGCAQLHTELTRDPRDAPWDPKGSAQLFDQIPAWDNAAERICCGHLRECRPHQSPRC
jgi:hypothetical protein